MQGVNVGGFLDSLHMVSYYLPIHFKALNSTDNRRILIYFFLFLPTIKMLINRSIFVQNIISSKF